MKLEFEIFPATTHSLKTDFKWGRYDRFELLFSHRSKGFVLKQVHNVRGKQADSSHYRFVQHLCWYEHFH